MKNLLFANGFKTIVLLVMFSFVFGCQKDNEIKPSTDGAQLPDTPYKGPVLKSTATYYYLVNRWKPDQRLYVGPYKVFDQSGYHPLLCSILKETSSGAGYLPFQWVMEWNTEGYCRIKNRWTNKYIALDYLLRYIEVGDSPEGNLFGQWSLEYAATSNGVNYWRIKNRRLGQYLNIDQATGSVQCSTKQPVEDWLNAQWRLANIDGTVITPPILHL